MTGLPPPRSVIAGRLQLHRILRWQTEHHLGLGRENHEGIANKGSNRLVLVDIAFRTHVLGPSILAR